MAGRRALWRSMRCSALALRVTLAQALTGVLGVELLGVCYAAAPLTRGVAVPMCKILRVELLPVSRAATLCRAVRVE
jgi:hypothetical protein